MRCILFFLWGEMMPIKKMCPRCRRVIDLSKTYCDECSKRMKRTSNKEYDTYSRSSKASGVYQSKEWELKREEILSYYHHLDIYEYFINRKVIPANTVHHIVELDKNIKLAFENDNLIPLSCGNHNFIHKLYKLDYGNTIKMLFSIKATWETEIAPATVKKS